MIRNDLFAERCIRDIYRVEIEEPDLKNNKLRIFKCYCPSFLKGKTGARDVVTP